MKYLALLISRKMSYMIIGLWIHLFKTAGGAGKNKHVVKHSTQGYASLCILHS